MNYETPAAAAYREFAVLGAMIRDLHPRVGDTRPSPDGGVEHYTGTEYGWVKEASDGRA